MSKSKWIGFAILAFGFFLLLTAAPGRPAAGDQTPGPAYSEWSKPEPATGVNTASAEYPNGISRDGLSLYFQRTNPGTGEDLYVARRLDPESDWGVATRLPDTVNSTYNDRAAFISADGHRLYFASDRPGGMGGSDLYVSWRRHVHDDGGWEEAVNLSTVNSVGFDSGPTVFENEESGQMELYFNSAPFPGGLQAVADIYRSVLGPGGFGPPVVMTELNSPVQEGRPYLRRDGREIHFQSNRAGSLSIWTATRATTSQPWSTPTLAIASADLEDASVTGVTTPVLCWDNKTLLLGAVRPGIDMGNIYVSHREKLRGK